MTRSLPIVLVLGLSLMACSSGEEKAPPAPPAPPVAKPAPPKEVPPPAPVPRLPASLG